MVIPFFLCIFAYMNSNCNFELQDVVKILKEQSLMTKAYVIDEYIRILARELGSNCQTKSFVDFILSFKDKNITELTRRIDDVISVNYVPAVEYIKRNNK